MTDPETIEQRLREHATDWNGAQMPDAEPAMGDPTAGTLREAADLIASLREQIRRVQSAAKTIMIHEADELRRLREGAQEAHLAKLTLDSEREANARLTDEVESLRAERDVLREALTLIAADPAPEQDRSNWDAIVREHIDIARAALAAGEGGR